ncbi:ATP-binding protein [Patescibacteria group bacterium]
MTIRRRIVTLVMLLVLATSTVSVYLSIRMGRANELERHFFNLDRLTAAAEVYAGHWYREAGQQTEYLVAAIESGNITYRQTIDRSALDTLISTYQSSIDAVRTISLIEIQRGEVLVSSNPVEVGKIRSHLDWFVEGQERLTFSDIVASEDGPSVFSTAPVRDQAGAVMAVVEVEFDYSAVSELLYVLTIGETSETYLVDRYGFGLTDLRLSNVEPGRYVVRSEAVEACLRGEGGRGTYLDYRGVEVLGSFRWDFDHSLCVISEIDAADVFSSVDSFGQALAVTGIAVSLAAMAMAFILATLLTSGLQRLYRAAQRFSKGDYSARLNESTDDEIGRLARVFNAMADRVSRSHDELEETIRMRTKDLSQALEDLQEVDRMKDDFLNVSSHEMKTPLIPIKTQAQLLLRGAYGKLNAKQKHAVEMILSNEESERRIVQDVLDISKLRSNKLALAIEPFALNDVVAETVQGYAEIAAKCGLTLEMNVPPDRIVVNADLVRIGQVLRNLIDNAIKFTDEGSVHVTLTQEGGRAVITVEDTGIGMSEDTLGKLFTPFFQVTQKAKRKRGGTGLGLSICKGIVEAHGGEIRVSSEGLGKGSTVTVSLPVAATEGL